MGRIKKKRFSMSRDATIKRDWELTHPRSGTAPTAPHGATCGGGGRPWQWRWNRLLHRCQAGCIFGHVLSIHGVTHHYIMLCIYICVCFILYIYIYTHTHICIYIIDQFVCLILLHGIPACFAAKIWQSSLSPRCAEWRVDQRQALRRAAHLMGVFLSHGGTVGVPRHPDSWMVY